MTSSEYIVLADQVREHRRILETAEQQLRSLAYRAAAGEKTVVTPDERVSKLLRRYADALAALSGRFHDTARNLGRRARDIG